MSKDHVEITTYIMNLQLFKEHKYKRIKGFFFTIKNIIRNKYRWQN